MGVPQDRAARRLLGKVLEGRYRIDDFIGRGAMGLVFRATMLADKKQVALKVMRTDVMEDETQLARFYREAKATMSLDHPHIIKVFESGQFSDGTPFMSMEFVEGLPLNKLIKEQAPLDPQRIARILLQVSTALAEAHQKGIAHRDLKPGNIMVMPGSAGLEPIKVLDFGIAKLLGDAEAAQLTQAGFALGTPHYMSPEQAKGKPLDGRCDLYSLGVIGYEMISGKVPFAGESSVDVIMQHLTRPIPALPSTVTSTIQAKQLAEVIYRCMEKERERRVQSAEELADMMRVVLGQTVKRPVRLTPSTLQKTPAISPEESESTMALNAEDLEGLGVTPAAEAAPAPQQAQAFYEATPSDATTSAGGGESTMALDAEQLQSLGVPQEAPAPQAAAPAIEESESTMALDAADLQGLMGDAGTVEPEEATMALNAMEDLSGMLESSGDAQGGSQEEQRSALFQQLDDSMSGAPSAAEAAAAVAANEGVEHGDATMMFNVASELGTVDHAVEQEGETMMVNLADVEAATGGLSSAEQGDETMMVNLADVEGVKGSPIAVVQEDETMMFDVAEVAGQPQPGPEQEDETMMFDQSQIEGHQQTGIDQDGSTMMFDAAEAQPLLDQVEPAGAPAQVAPAQVAPAPVRVPMAGNQEGTMQMDEGRDAASAARPMSPQQQEMETGPGVRSPAPHLAARLPTPASSNNLMILILIAIGSLAIISAGVFFLLQ
jgi:serine/threonine protein kinase